MQKIRLDDLGKEEQIIICYLLDDWCMLYQLVGALQTHLGYNEEVAFIKVFDVLRSLLNKGYIEIGEPPGDNSGGFLAWGKNKEYLMKQLSTLQANPHKVLSGEESTKVWVQLSKHGFDSLQHLLDECNK